MPRRTDLLIIGAGPFGLGLARYARAHDIDHLIVGSPMAFWTENMPAGMLLRSGIRWHLDPEGELHFRRYAREQGVDIERLDPLRLDAYLEYVAWFQKAAGIDVLDERVEKLEPRTPHAATGRFVARLGNGEEVVADAVVLALGFHSFAHTPPELAERLPKDRRTHTRDFVDFREVSGQRLAIVGGRQSAFEWAALLQEAGAESVQVIYRHETPAFEPSDWSWVEGMLDESERRPGWWRGLPDAERERIGQAFWAEGRLKLEPWLADRIDVPSVCRWPKTRIGASQVTDAGRLRLDLLDPEDAARGSVEVDHVVLATGYQVDIARVQLLGSRLRRDLRVVDGAAPLDPHFRTSVPGLYMTSMPATRDFGPFLAFTVSVRATSRILGNAVAADLAARRA